MPPDRSTLADLRDKYRRIEALRARRAVDSGDVPQRELRALATEFPGALRELDRLPPEELAARIDALDRALGGAPAERWMDALVAYHALLRLALLLRLGGARPAVPEVQTWLGSDEARGLLGALPEALRDALAEPGALLASLLHPPDGRLNRLVLAAVGGALGVSSGWVEGLLDGSARAASEPSPELAPPELAPP